MHGLSVRGTTPPTHTHNMISGQVGTILSNLHLPPIFPPQKKKQCLFWTFSFLGHFQMFHPIKDSFQMLIKEKKDLPQKQSLLDNTPLRATSSSFLSPSNLSLFTSLPLKMAPSSIRADCVLGLTSPLVALNPPSLLSPPHHSSHKSRCYPSPWGNVTPYWCVKTQGIVTPPPSDLSQTSGARQRSTLSKPVCFFREQPFSHRQIPKSCLCRHVKEIKKTVHKAHRKLCPRKKPDFEASINEFVYVQLLLTEASWQTKIAAKINISSTGGCECWGWKVVCACSCVKNPLNPMFFRSATKTIHTNSSHIIQNSRHTNSPLMMCQIQKAW